MSKDIDFSKVDVKFYERMCYPKHNQDLHIHSEDVRDIVPVLKKNSQK